MATHSRILAWKMPWTEEPGGIQSMGLKRIGHDWATKLARLWYSGYLEEELLWDWVVSWVNSPDPSSPVRCRFCFLPEWTAVKQCLFIFGFWVDIFLGIKAKRTCYSCCSVTMSCPTRWPHGLQHARLLCPPLSPGVCSNSYPLSWCCCLTTC